jgi:hypothetical protein
MDRASRLWKDMPLEKRVLAAEAFWRDRDSPDANAQQQEAVGVLARRLNFRARSIQALPVERRARHLAQVSDVADAIAGRALIAYHFTHRRPLMSAFLDAVGIAHEDGLITEDDVKAPPEDRLAAAVSAVRSSFDAADVDLYLRTLAALDGETWAGIPAVLNG